MSTNVGNEIRQKRNELLRRKYKYPANYQEAQLHRKANMFGFSSPYMDGGESTPTCPCCDCLINTIQLPICYETSPSQPEISGKVFLLPPGASMYFTFIKMAMLYILMRICIFDGFTMLFSLGGHYCIDNPKICQTFLSSLSGYNLANKADVYWVEAMDIMSLTFTIFSIIFFLVFRRYQHKLNNFLMFSHKGEEEYSIFMYNIPWYKLVATKNKIGQIKQQLEQQIRSWRKKLQGTSDEQELTDYEIQFKQMMNNSYHRSKIQTQPIVHTIIECHDISEIQNLKLVEEKFIEEKDSRLYKCQEQNQNESANNPYRKGINIFEISKQIFHQQYLNVCKNYAEAQSQQFFITHFTGKIFIIFSFQHYRAYFNDRYIINNDPFNFKLRLQRPLKKQLKNSQKLDDQNIQTEQYGEQIKLSMKQATPPTDVLWKNMKVTDLQRLKSVGQSYLVLTMTLCFSFGALLGLQVLQISLNKGLDPTKDTKSMIMGNILSIAMAILTTLINMILASAINKLTNSQRHQTKSDQLTSLIVKTALAQFINTSIIYYVLWKISGVSFLSDLKYPMVKDGLYNKIFGLLSVSAVITLGLEISMPGFYIGRLINYFTYKQKKYVDEYQFILNKNLQLPQFDFAKQYSFYLVMVYISSFFAVLIPFSSVMIIVIFAVKYWVDKYNLFKRSSNPAEFGFYLSRLILKCFECSLLIFVIGFWIWMEEINVQQSRRSLTLRIINLFLALIYVSLAVFSPAWIEKKLFKQQSVLDQECYSIEIEDQEIKKSYKKQNPGTAFLRDVPVIVEEDQVQNSLNYTRKDMYIPLYDARIMEFLQTNRTCKC